MSIVKVSILTILTREFVKRTEDMILKRTNRKTSISESMSWRLHEELKYEIFTIILWMMKRLRREDIGISSKHPWEIIRTLDGTSTDVRRTQIKWNICVDFAETISWSGDSAPLRSHYPISDRCEMSLMCHTTNCSYKFLIDIMIQHSFSSDTGTDLFWMNRLWSVCPVLRFSWIGSPDLSSRLSNYLFTQTSPDKSRPWHVLIWTVLNCLR